MPLTLDSVDHQLADLYQRLRRAEHLECWALVIELEAKAELLWDARKILTTARDRDNH